MWKTRVIGLVVAAGLLVGGTALAAGGGNYSTHLKGDQEVAPGVASDTRAQGQATFHLSADGTELRYKLNVANIENVFMAHIHRGGAGTSGPIVVWLYPGTTPNVQAPPGGGRLQGPIAEGVITATDLVGPLSGQPLSALVALIEGGTAYVNVHTNDGEAPINTGPGDFPGGEIRGQLP